MEDAQRDALLEMADEWRFRALAEDGRYRGSGNRVHLAIADTLTECANAVQSIVDPAEPAPAAGERGTETREEG